jgi:hypothetical protein
MRRRAFCHGTMRLWKSNGRRNAVSMLLNPQRWRCALLDLHADVTELEVDRTRRCRFLRVRTRIHTNGIRKRSARRICCHRGSDGSQIVRRRRGGVHRGHRQTSAR